MSSRGGVRVFEGRVYARARYGNDERVEVRLPWASPDDLEPARERAAFIAELCDRLVAGHRTDLIKRTAKLAARAADAKTLETIKASVELYAKEGKSAAKSHRATFGDVSSMWTSGEIRKKYPDHAGKKTDFRIEIGRLNRYILKHVKDVPIAEFERLHADLVMSNLPAHRVKKSATRRQVAQIISRVLNLAVMPLGLIKATPLPKGWLPRVEQGKHYSCLFPQEEAKFLACTQIEEAFRLFVGILDREGMRVSELLDCDWWQWNTAVGTFTATKTKTGDPRMWATRPDVTRAMRLWEARYGKTKAQPFSDLLAAKDAKLYLATRLRDGLALAGVTRKELLESTEFTGKLRTHDMRATFVTVSLAEGRPDTWIRDRTGHKTLSMVDRYRRTARQFAELQLGSLADLVEGLGWVISRVIPAIAVGDDADLSVDDDEGFRRKDSNFRKRNQKPRGAVAPQRAAGSDGVIGAGDQPAPAGSPTDPPSLRPLGADLQSYVADRLIEAYPHAFGGSEEALLTPLAKAAKALVRGRLPRKARGSR